jgi:divalent metal cation (Fe/Co/Zn/Cd) transporter
MIASMLVPILIFVVCFGAGTTASARWLPDLGAGPVGSLAFFTVCGLLGAALSLLGIHVYLIAKEIDHLHLELVSDKAELLAGGIRDILFEVGSLVGLAAIVFLLAPRLRTSTPTA